MKNSSESNRTNILSNAMKNLRIRKLLGMLIVFVMISTSFFTVVASGAEGPEIWTSQDEYVPGETVDIIGINFVQGIPVTINISHTSFGYRLYTATPTFDGRFVCSDYIAEWVDNPSELVNVTATQLTASGVKVAYTEFKDPAAYIQAWTLKPHHRWTTGNTAGYNEGDSVPAEVVLDKNQFGGASQVDISIGLDFIDLADPSNPVYGFDYLTQYWTDPPAAPFNTYTNSSSPFWVDPSQGTITTQYRSANIYDGGSKQMVQVWNFTVQFAAGASMAEVKFGAHFALTSIPLGILGASYYSGSNLHIRMVDIDPDGCNGNMDVPFPVKEILIPPKMNIEKNCTPCQVIEGDIITFTIHFNNTGQAYAHVYIWDIFPSIIDIIPGSFLFWNSELPIPLPPSPGPVIVGNEWQWSIGMYRGTGPDDSLPVLESWLQFQAVVNTSIEGCYENWVYLSYTDDHGGIFPIEMDWCRFCIIGQPSISIEKSGPLYAHVGDTVTYTYNVTNTGYVDLVDVDVVDDVAGVVVMNDSLAKGQYRIYTLSYTISASDPDPLPNNVTANGTDTYGRIVVDNSSWLIDILHPEIDVTKVGDKTCAEVGESVYYWINVTNPSTDTDLFNVTVVDSLFGTIYTGTLLSGQIIYLGGFFTVTDPANDPLVNVVVAEGEDLLHLWVSDSDSWSVDILHPMIEVTKWADKDCAEVGEVVTYYITVTNPSPDTYMDFILYDSLFGVIWGYGTGITGDMWGDPYWTLAPGESVTFGGAPSGDTVWQDGYVWIAKLAYTVQITDPDPLVNYAYVEAWDYQDHYVEAWSWEWIVDILHPMIYVEKWADKDCAEVGEIVTYYIMVYNPSHDTYMDFILYDSLFGVIWGYGTGITGDMFGDPYWTLAPGEMVTFGGDPNGDVIWQDGYVYIAKLAYAVQPTDPDPLINYAWVEAWDYQDHYVDACSWEWVVDILHPGIEIYKWADKECAEIGELVTYYITVTNPSPDTYMDFVLYDSLFGVIWGYGTGITGDNWGDPYWMLAPGESVTFGGDSWQDTIWQDGYVYIAKLAYVVTDQDPDPLVNYAYVDAWDYQDHWVYAYSFDWIVDILHPGIEIYKWADKDCAEIGEVVTYYITVTNPSPDTNMDFILYDSLFGVIWGWGTGILGDMWGDPYWTLAPGESVTFGGDPSGDTVWQDGYVYIAQLAYPVQPTDPDPLINYAWVEAWDYQYHYVEACSWEWIVDILHPEIYVEKWANKDCAEIGEVVTYYITVTNPSPDTNMDFILYDSLFGVIWGYGTGITGDMFGDPYWTLAPGEMVTFGGDPNGDVIWQDGYVYIAKLAYAVQPTDPDPLINYAWVEAWDYQDHYVEAYSWEWFVDILHPGIEVYKWADKDCAEIGELVTYYITVTNPSSDTYMDFILYDSIFGVIWGYGTGITGDMWGDPYWTLAPGESIMFGGDPNGDVIWQDGYVYIAKLAYAVQPTDPDPLINYAWVEAWDYQDHYREAWSWDWIVDILHPMIYVEKWADKDCAEIGEVVTYSIMVYNPSHDTYMDFILYDSLFGVIWGYGTGITGDMFGDPYWTLAPGEMVTFGGDPNGDVIWQDGYVYIARLAYAVQASDPDPLINYAYVEAWDYQNHYREACSWEWVVDILHPDIYVEKRADKDCAAIGELVTYYITVTNPSPDTYMDFILYDSLFGVIWGWGTGITGDMWGDPYWTLAPGESVTFGGDPNGDTVWQDGYVWIAKLAYTVQIDDPDPLINYAWVEAWDYQDHYVDACSWEWVVDILHPGIEIYKRADKDCAEIGELVTYYITVTNPSPDTYMDFVLYDSLFGVIWGWGTGILGDMWGDPYWTLAPGESIMFGGDPSGDTVWQDGYVWIAKLAYTVQITDPDPLVNYAYVEAWDYQYHYVKAWSWEWIVDILHPMIYVEKWADKECAEIGEVVTYYITVTNPSPDTNMDFILYDSLFGVIWGWGTGITGDMFGDPYWTLAPGEMVTFGGRPSGDMIWQDGYVYIARLAYAVQPTDPDPLINYAWVEAWDYQDHYVEAYSLEWIVDIFHPDIIVEKWADVTCAAEGDIVTYTIVVTNPSHDTWMYYDAYDYLLGWVGSGWLAPGASSDPYTIPYLVPYIPPEPPGVWELYNYVEVYAWDEQNHYRWNWSEWWIDIYHPDIEIIKYADVECAAEGDIVTYTIVVTNPSLDTWMNYDLYDYLLGDPITGYIGSGYLGPGEYDTHVIPYLVPYIPADPSGWPELYNYVEVIAWDDQYWTSEDWWNHVVYDWSEWWVDILHPAIGIDKTAEKSCAHVGETVIYYIRVWNPSPDTWMDFILTDSLLGVIWGYGTGITGDMFGDPYWTLAPGESVTFGGDPFGDWIWQDGYVYIAKMAYTVTAEDDDPLRNIAEVEAWDYQYWTSEQWWNHIVSAWDDHSVDILHPSIELTKEGPLEAAAGEVITYYVNVTNNASDTILYNVTVTDSLVGVIAFILVLGVGQTICITYAYTVPAGISLLNNTACASGEDKQHVWVRDCDSWTVYIPGNVNGYKYADLNLNQLMEGGEPRLENWLILLNGILSAGGYDNRTRLTDSNGYYEFTKLKAGSYTVSEFLQSGWKNITVSIYSFNIHGGETLVRNFGNMPSGNISGYKWGDCDLDGIWDPWELPIGGWTIYLDGTDMNGMPVSALTMTDSSGYYKFKDLLPGVYTIIEEDRTGWWHTTPSSIVVDVSALVSFEVTDINFGNVEYGKITGYKWLDEFMNGYRDGYEPLLEGWTIWLTGVLMNGMIVLPTFTVTDANGYYEFNNLLPGDYHIWEIIPPGWTNITPAEYFITITCGYVHTCAKFGNVPLGLIDGWKFIDWDMDRQKDGDEPGIPGWAITLTGWLNDGDWPYSPVNATTVGPITIYTDANGYWIFPNLLPGIYMVTEESRAGWYHTTPSLFSFWITPGMKVTDVKFGNVPYICIWGYKFEDINGDGINDSEPGLPGWVIVLEGFQNDGVYVYRELITDELGYFATCFTILPGEYRLYEIIQEGWYNTTPYCYSVIPQVPDVMMVNDELIVEPLDYQYDFGNFKLGKIFGWKYEDMNGNGILDIEDQPIAGWVINLDLPMGGTLITVTNETGYYEFIGLPAGNYIVWEADVPGWIHTTPSAYFVTILSGYVVEIPIFLNTQLGKIYGYKFEDLNSNGIWDDGEPGIPRWTIYMIWDFDPTVYIAVTDGNGYYEFSNLLPDPMYMIWEEQRPGWTPTNETWEIVTLLSGDVIRIHDFGNFKNVTIEVFKYEDIWADGEYDDGTDIPIEGWNITVAGPGIPGGSVVLQTDSNGYASVEVAVAGNYTITEEDRDGWCHTTPPEVVLEIESGDVPEVIEFGNFECVEIIIFKYEDVNSDGRYDPEIDRPLPGWTIGIDSIWGYTEYFTTDANGTVTITFCRSDLFILFEELPDGWCQITPESEYYEVMIWSGTAWDRDLDQERYYYVFGNFECVELIIFKYWDKCSNGWYDPFLGDEPLERWLFWIFGPAYPGGIMEITDAGGYIALTICRAGTYVITEDDWVGWSHIVPLNGTYVVDIESGDGIIELWFGNYRDVIIPIFKYNDVNSNGQWDAGEPGLEGWYFEMKRAGDNVTYSGYTDAGGNLNLTVNRSGIYTITEEDRAGWTHINPLNGMRLVIVTSGTVIPLQEFGNFHNVPIIIFKFDDRNANGEYEPWDGDVPIPDWYFNLQILDDDLGYWILIDEGYTNESGILIFEVNRSGTYAVVEEYRAGWWIIKPDNGYYIFDVYSCMGEVYLEFANFKMGKIYGYKWNDLNGNGEWDTGEPPLANWNITIESISGPGYIYSQDVTDQNGYYEFTGLPPGWYEVSEEVKTGWMATSPPEVEVEIWGHSEVRVDFFNFELGCIDGYKYEDHNGNGIYDNDDTPIEGWWIYLAITGWEMNEIGPISFIAIIDMVQTDTNGYYRFCGLGPGTYVVSEESRTGWIPTNDTSETVVMTSGSHIRIHDFMNFQLGIIYGWKWEDLNSNGVWDPNEPPKERWPIHMIRDALPDIETVYTDENGYFAFEGLEVDYYIIWEEELPGWCNTTQTWALVDIFSGSVIELDPFGNFECVYIPIFKYEDVNGNGVYDNGDVPIEGWMFTIEGYGAPKIVYTDPDGWAFVEICHAGIYTITEEDRAGWMHVNPASGNYTVEILSGMILRPFEFGNFRLGTITGQKFYDQNLNGIKEGSEVGLANWVIWINGSLVGGGWLNFTRLTDSSGNFEVSGLPAGIYVVSERLEYAPAGWVPTTPAIWIVAIGSGSATSVSFGNAVFGVIWGYKFYDKDVDGVHDGLEPGLDSWTIVLEGVTDYGAPVYRTTVTSGGGMYVFTDVQPGRYNVTEFLPGNWINTTPLPVVVDVSGIMQGFDIQVNIGNIRYTWIHGYKFLDTYEEDFPWWPNGIFDIDEFGLGNWEITLEGWTDMGEYVQRVTYTDNIGDIGYYEFKNVLPGTYWVNETLLTGYHATKPISYMIIIYPHPLGPFEIEIYFGNLIPELDPEIMFVFEEGWNLWSAPIQVDGLTAKGLLEAIGSSGLMVSKLNKSTGIYTSYVAGDGLDEDFPIVLGEGYYVYSTQKTVFCLIGDIVASSEATLVSGWNIVGYNTLQPTTASELLTMVDGCSALMVSYLDAETGRYYSYVIGDGAEYNFNITPGRAYFLWVDGPGELVFG